MAKLDLSVAVGDYDRTRALIDGTVAIDGVDPVYMTLVPEEIFFRAFRAAELTSASCRCRATQSRPRKTIVFSYIAVPAFVSRAFRHTSVYVRTDRVKKPADLKGRKVGVPEYSAHGQRVGARLSRRRLWCQAGGHPLDTRRHRGGRTAGKAHDQAAPRRASQQCAGRRNDFGLYWRPVRSTGSIAPRPPALVEKGRSKHWLAVQRSDGGSHGLF